MADRPIRLEPRNRGWFDVWVGDTQLPTTIHLDDTGDLAEMVWAEVHRQDMRVAMQREGLI